MTPVITMFAAWGLVAIYMLRVYRRQGLELGATVNSGPNWFEDATLPPLTIQMAPLCLMLLGLSFLLAHLLPTSEFDAALMFLLFGVSIAVFDKCWKVDLRTFASGFAMKQSLISLVVAVVIVVACSAAVSEREALFAVPAILIAVAITRACYANRNGVE